MGRRKPLLDAMTGLTGIDAERAKYDHMWRQSDYHRYSPGAASVGHALKMLPCVPGQSIIDWGCGPGAAMRLLASAGLQVTGVDLSSVAAGFCGAGVVVGDIATVTLPPAEWAYCCDVMEHLPPDRVDAALANIARHTLLGGYLRICHVPDGFGEGALHLTVEPSEWWTPRIAKHFRIAAHGAVGDRDSSWWVVSHV